MQTPIRFAVIGLGHIGRRHASLIVAARGAELVALVDVLPRSEVRWPEGVDEAVPYLASPSDLRTCTSTTLGVNQSSGLPAPDVVCVCTPNGLHAPQAIELLEAGYHVVVEKPLALTVAEADAIIAAAERADRRVFGVMQNRYSPASAWLKETLDSGKPGRILQVHLDCFWNRDHRYYTLPPDGRPHPWHGHKELDGGVLFTQFAHFIDLLCWCFGEVTVHSARFANQNHEDHHVFADSGTVHFSVGEGTLGSLNFSTAVWDRNFESTLTVVAERGTIKLGGQYMNTVRYCHVEGMDFPELPPSNPANNYGPYTGSAANHHFVIDNVVEVLKGRGEVATSAAEGREVVRVIGEMYAAGGH